MTVDDDPVSPSVGAARDGAATDGPPSAGPAFDEAPLRAAWQQVRGAADPRCEALTDALRAVAHDARSQGAPVTALLRALDRLAAADGAAAGFARVRAWAGTQVIRAYYRDD